MKNETVEAETVERKAGLIGSLSSLARALTAQCFLHHCSFCGCVLISTNVALRYFSDLCPECTKKIRTSQGGN
jgi:hypothetical protein